jgi:hypothetical protein
VHEKKSFPGPLFDGELGRKKIQKMTNFEANFRLVQVSKSVQVIPIYKA